MKKINERKIIKSLETLGEGIYSFSKDALRLGVLSAIVAGAWFVGYNHGKNEYYPEIAEIVDQADNPKLVLDDKYLLRHNSDLSDPNKIVFTSHKYKGNEK